MKNSFFTCSKNFETRPSYQMRTLKVLIELYTSFSFNTQTLKSSRLLVFSFFLSCRCFWTAQRKFSSHLTDSCCWSACDQYPCARRKIFTEQMLHKLLFRIHVTIPCCFSLFPSRQCFWIDRKKIFINDFLITTQDTCDQ